MTQVRSPAARLIAAVLTNMAMGVIYVWGLFLLPLETFLARPRADLSLVASLALVAFTVGMVIHDRVLKRLGLAKFAALAFAFAACGHLLFAAFPTYPGLALGYGVLFGIGAGLGYGLALALATAVANGLRAFAVGLAMAAFASSGIFLPMVLGPLIRTTSPPVSFSVIGAGMLMAGLFVIALLLNGTGARDGDIELAERPSAASPSFFDSGVVTLGIVFFAICYAGLLGVSQAAGMVASNGLSPRVVDTSLVMLTAGYLGGSLLGGKLVEIISGRATLVVASTLAALGLCFLNLSAPMLVLAGALAVGFAFGSSASFMPILIGERFGPAMIGPVYGKLIAFYGLAGLIAPWLSGVLFEQTKGYMPAVSIGIALCVLSVLLGARMRTASPPIA